MSVDDAAERLVFEDVERGSASAEVKWRHGTSRPSLFKLANPKCPYGCESR